MWHSIYCVRDAYVHFTCCLILAPLVDYRADQSRDELRFTKLSCSFSKLYRRTPTFRTTIVHAPTYMMVVYLFAFFWREQFFNARTLTINQCIFPTENRSIPNRPAVDIQQIFTVLASIHSLWVFCSGQIRSDTFHHPFYLSKHPASYLCSRAVWEALILKRDAWRCDLPRARHDCMEVESFHWGLARLAKHRCCRQHW